VEQLIQVEEVVQVQEELQVVVHFLLVQGVLASLLLEHQDQQIFLQGQEQTQLQHYRHQLEVVKWLHSLFLEV
jgi:hypothetical protein